MELHNFCATASNSRGIGKIFVHRQILNLMSHFLIILEAKSSVSHYILFYMSIHVDASSYYAVVVTDVAAADYFAVVVEFG